MLCPSYCPGCHHCESSPKCCDHCQEADAVIDGYCEPCFDMIEADRAMDALEASDMSPANDNASKTTGVL